MNLCFNVATVLLVSFGGKDSDHDASGGAVNPWAGGALALDAFSDDP